MRSPSLFVFEEVLSNSFGSALEGLLGREVRNEVYHILETRGIQNDEVPSKFDKVIEALLQVFGESSRVIIHRVLRVLYEKYSLPVDFSYQETLVDRLIVLRNRIIVDHLRPRGIEEVDFFPDKEKEPQEQESSTARRKTGWPSFYRMKKGLGSNSNRD